MSALGISIREFARRDGCNDKLVRRALETGKLKTLSDGTLDPALVGTSWRKSNRRPAAGADSVADVRTQVSAPPKLSALSQSESESAAQAAERIIAQNGVPYSLPEAERVKENYLALLRQLEYDQKSGQVVSVAEVSRAVGQEYAKVRTRLLAIPAEQAPRIHRLKTAAEIQDALQTIIVEALEELTRDGASAAG